MRRAGFAGFAGALGVVLCAAPGPAAAADLPPLLGVPLQVSIPVAPIAFRSNGQSHLVYEIQITNLSPTPWTLQHVDVRDEQGAKLLAVDAGELAGLLWRPGSQRGAEGASSDTVAAGESMFAYMWIDLEGKAALPTSLGHHLLVKRTGEAEPRELEAPTTVVSDTLPKISAPLRGTDWLAVNGPSNTSRHRRALLVLDGSPHIAQRYAIDWVRVGPDSKTFRGDKNDNRSYLCYGNEVLAAADGVVVEIKDGIRENVPQQPPAVPITLETIAGNHIDLDLGGGVFALYAHLQPGSLRVKPGDTVRRGQVLGLLGNSGNSTEPHLHFQLMNRNSPLGSEGLPYALAEYTIVKRVTGGLGAGLDAVKLAAPEKHHGEMPMEMQLVNFN